MTFYYLVRAATPFTGDWGRDSAGVLRVPVCTGPYLLGFLSTEQGFRFCFEARRRALPHLVADLHRFLNRDFVRAGLTGHANVMLQSGRTVGSYRRSDGDQLRRFAVHRQSPCLGPVYNESAASETRERDSEGRKGGTGSRRPAQKRTSIGARSERLVRWSAAGDGQALLAGHQEEPVVAAVATEIGTGGRGSCSLCFAIDRRQREIYSHRRTRRLYSVYSRPNLRSRYASSGAMAKR